MITTLHIVLVASFIAVTSVLLGMTIIQRCRIRRVKMTWVSRRTGSFLIWPSVFMGLVLVFTLYSRNTLSAVDDSVFAGYILGGMLWFVATFLSGSVVVTDYGIIPETGRRAEAVGWGQISDWFEQNNASHARFTFLYQDLAGAHQRFDVLVPSTRVEAFRCLVRMKLDQSAVVHKERIRHGQALNN